MAVVGLERMPKIKNHRQGTSRGNSLAYHSCTGATRRQYMYSHHIERKELPLACTLLISDVNKKMVTNDRSSEKEV